MRLPLNWLMDHITLNCETETIIQVLPSLGVEINQIIDMNYLLQDLILAKITKTCPHPDADKLLVCQLSDQHNNSYQVVCGDKKIKAGDNVIYATNNSYVPGWDDRITAKKIRGVESQGMICSLQELNLVKNQKNASVHILPDNIKLNLSAAEALDINMPILDLEITPNRSDLMSIMGIARELQAQELGTIKQLNKYEFYDRLNTQIQINLKDTSCFLYMGRVIQGCNNDIHLPDWMTNCLRSAKIMSVNPLTDIVNYVSHMLGIPMQIFDADCLTGSVINIENLTKPEVIPTISNGLLNENDSGYISTSKQLPVNTIVMRNEAAIINVNGVFGNTNYMCDKNSKNIYLGIGYFNRENLTITNRLIGFHTDNSLRIERGIDYNLMKHALDITTKYIIDILDGNVGTINITGDINDHDLPIKLKLDSVEQILGIKISPSLINKYLKNLGFVINKINSQVWEVTTPSWRNDCNHDVDLVEEIARSHGYRHLEKQDYIKLNKDFHELTPVQKLIKHVTQIMVSRGAHEIITVPFISQKEAEIFSINPSYQVENFILNTKDANQNTIRSSLLPGLLRCLDKNISRGCDWITLYETGAIFNDNTNPQNHTMNTGIVHYGQKYQKYWGSQTRDQDVFDIRGDIDAILHSLGFTSESYQIHYNEANSIKNNVYLPRYGGKYMIADTVVAYFGLLNPAACQSSQLKNQQIWIAELLLDNILLLKTPPKAAHYQSPYPVVRRDFCVLIEDNIQIQDLINIIKSIPLNVDIRIYTFDYYMPVKYQKLKSRSVTFAIDMIPKDTTFTNVEIQKICDMIIEVLNNQPGIRLR